jgi:hypothetical protein
MTTSRAATGALSGTLAGLVSGVVPARLQMLPSLAMPLGSHSAIIGGIVHLLTSAALGALFASYLGSTVHMRDLITSGVLFGSIWWLVVPILLIPTWVSQDTDLAVVHFALMSVAGQAIYGPVNGLVLYLLVRRRQRSTRRPGDSMCQPE